jgi:hypothetical protein
MKLVRSYVTYAPIVLLGQIEIPGGQLDREEWLWPMVAVAGVLIIAMSAAFGAGARRHDTAASATPDKKYSVAVADLTGAGGIRMPDSSH